MYPTPDFVSKRFRHFNKEMFGGKLPEVPIVMSRARTRLGQITYCRCSIPLVSDEVFNVKLRISTAFDLSEREWEDVIIHEMIHLCILHNRLHDTSAHGKVFRHLMQQINENYGRNITITHSSQEKQNNEGNAYESATQTKSPRGRWHVIAIATFGDGRTGLKVLPRVEPSILKFYNSVVRDSRITSINLYMCCDPYFEAFPNSSALKLHIIPAEEVMPHLKNAEQLGCDGHTITRHAERH